MFESESNWFSHNKSLIDHVRIDKEMKTDTVLSECNLCGINSDNPPSDHFFCDGKTTLCETCYLHHCMMSNN